MFYNYRKRTRDIFVGVFVELCNMLRNPIQSARLLRV